MDTTVILLLVCVALIAVTLILMAGFGCMLRVYLRRQAETMGEKYRPSYNLEKVYTRGAHENLGFPQENKVSDDEEKITNGNDDGVMKT